jgi:protein-glutamine gamma-glutamyltransferase
MLRLAQLQPSLLTHLPREARDTLFLLAVIAWVLLPQTGQIPVWCSVLAFGVLLWRGVLAVQSKPLPGFWWRISLLVLASVATYFTHKTLLGRDAGVTLIVVLLALKTLELRARRDAFVVFFLSFFTMLTNFFSSQSLATAAAMLVALLGLLTALVNAHMPVGKPPLIEAAKTAGWMALVGAPIMVVLFMLFPRLAPLWGIPSDGMTGRTGLSGSMQVGTMAQLALDDSIALRIKFEGAAPNPTDLYFRGPVLSSFDGREWKPLQASFAARFQAPANLQVLGEPIRYEITMEPTNRPWLLTLEATTNRPELPNHDLVMTPDLQWLSSKPFTDLVRYKVQSHTQFRHGPLKAVPGLQDFTELPPGFNPRTLQLATDIQRDPRYADKGAAGLLEGALERLRTGGYRYTLEPGVYGRETADEFWFDKKEGFCEHIASAFVVLMRSMSVPARVVTGYQGAQQNTVDNYWVVRQSDAHAWAEVWLEGRGWVRVDPTASVAPARIGEFQRLAAPQGLIAGAIGGLNPTLAANLRAAWEAVNNSWNQWVLNYTQSKQLDMLKNIGFQSPSWEHLGYLLAGLLTAAGLLGALWTLWERVRHDPWVYLLQRARKKLEKAGLVVPPACPPRALAQLARTQFGPAANSVCDWLLRLEAFRYAAHAPGSLVALRREFAALSWPVTSGAANPLPTAHTA